MPKEKKGTKENPIVVNINNFRDDELSEIPKALEIKEAAIKDDYCNYSYELMQGVGEGDIIGRKGAAVVHNDMLDAFEKLNVHLAVIDDAFRYSHIEIEDIDMMHSSELAGLFKVTGLKLRGNADNESVILVGTKFIKTGGYISLETPRIKFDSGYPFKNELHEAVYKCCDEVEQYMNGKIAPTFEQTEIDFEVPEKEFDNAAL
ncbi:MAG TPA: hypothetical protein VIM07_15040 [Chitinophagaceae bacterium]